MATLGPQFLGPIFLKISYDFLVGAGVVKSGIQSDHLDRALDGFPPGNNIISFPKEKVLLADI